MEEENIYGRPQMMGQARDEEEEGDVKQKISIVSRKLLPCSNDSYVFKRRQFVELEQFRHGWLCDRLVTVDDDVRHSDAVLKVPLFLLLQSQCLGRVCCRIPIIWQHLAVLRETRGCSLANR